MAISYNNQITKNFRGRVGDVVLRCVGDKSILSKRPDCSKVIKTPAQLKMMDRFRKAVKYGQYAMNNPDLCRYYKKKDKHRSTYHMGMSDYLSRSVDEILDVTGYQGLPGNIITVSAWRRWKVEGVTIVIFNAAGEAVECGAAIPADVLYPAKWNYIASRENDKYQGGRVEVTITYEKGYEVKEEIEIKGP